MASKKPKPSAKLRKAKAIEWRERLIKIERMPASALLDHPFNPKIHPDSQKEPLAGLLSEVGKVDILKAYLSERNEGALTLWDGHCRRELRPDEIWNVGIYDLTDAEADLLLATFDPIGWQAEQSKQRLESLMDTIKAGNSHVVSFLAEQGVRLGIINQLNGQHGEAQDAEPQIDRAAELNKKWKVKPGDLWLIGEHRLLCGDSTKAEDVARVMNGKKAELAAVDPPYNVGIVYDGETVNDKKTQENYKAFSVAWFEQCQAYSDRQIITPGCNNLASWCRWFDPYHIAPWTKTNSMTNGKVSRFWCWEPVFFFGDKWQRSRSNDIFDFPIGQQKDIANHPCPKPLKMWADLIESYTEADALIYESFGGSGTSLVAAQNLGRKCFALEISPDYCAVILERMATTFPSLTIKREGEKPAKSKKR